MELDAYQRETRRTSGTDPRSVDALVCYSLGLAGEAGEVVDLMKKRLYHGRTVGPETFAKELGDVLWYLARLADEMGLSLGDIAAANLRKLALRYPDGFSHAASARRADVSYGDAEFDPPGSDEGGGGRR